MSKTLFVEKSSLISEKIEALNLSDSERANAFTALAKANTLVDIGLEIGEFLRNRASRLFATRAAA